MLHTLRARQILRIDLNTLWHFMSSPENLAAITPAYMNFRIITSLEDTEMYAGQIIEYYITPLAGIKMHWVTEITHVQDKTYFVDEQRKGPYAFWHHQHFLKEVPGGVEMTDILHYKIPFGWLGELANRFYVDKKVKEIFAYRRKTLEKLFNT